MEVTDANIQALAAYMKGTLDPDVKTRKEAENFLVSVERNKNYPVLLLKLLTCENVELFVRQAAAITFKNYVKRNWEVDAEDNIHADDRLAIKQLVVELMLQSPEGIQKQLRAAIQIIGKHDFPEHWADLIKILVQHIGSGDFRVINGALQTANSLFKRYRHEMRTDTLFLEIKYVLQEFAPTLTTLFINTLELMKTHEKNPEAVKTLGDSLLIIAKIFYSLNYQDLPEYFEDNMQAWMPRLCDLLSYTNPLLQTDSESEPGVLEKLKTEICESAALYAQKYSEEFELFLGNFVTAVWNLLTTTSAALKYDYLVGSAISFLAQVAYRIQNKGLFENDETMGSICEKVIIPNMEFRECDEELFEDSPEEYIRRDTEGSDQETRRRAACDFVRALSMNFEEKITMIFSQYVNAMLAQYATNPNAEWRRKDAALYLITSLAAKAQTQKSGITKANTLVDVNSFLTQHVLPELNDENIDERPVVKADCLRYVLVFRSILDPNAVRSAIPAVVKHLADKSVVAHSYAASTIDKILTMPEKIVSAQDLQGVMEPLLKNLFGIFQREGSSENEYAMQAIMRVLACLGDAVVPILAPLLPTLMGKLSAAVQNPKNPRHNHYLMESVCCAIQAGCKADATTACESFESNLFPIFQEILQKDVTEFVPYVFQILALLLEMRAQYKLPLPEPYLALLQMLILPEVWETHANIPPLSRLMRAFINLGQGRVVTPERMENFMKLFCRLISSKTFDGEGFNIVQTIMESQTGPELLQPQFKQIFTWIFTRLSRGRTPKFTKHLMVFCSHFAVKFSPQMLIETMEGLQAGLFGMYLDRVVGLDLQKVTGNEDRTIVATGLIKLLTCEPMVNGKFADKWGQTFSCLVDFLHLPPEQSTARNDLELEFGEGSYADPFETNVGYHGSYSRLVFAGRGVKFPFTGQVQDVNAFLANSLNSIRAVDANKLPKLISGLPELDAQQKVANFLRAMNIAV